MAEQLITSSVLIAVVAVIRRLLRGRIAPALQYGLWLLVLLRLLVPVSLFRSPVGVAQAAKPVTARVETVMEVSRFVPGQAPLAPAVQGTTAAAVTPAARENSFGLSLAAVAKFVWLVGSGVMAVWFIHVNGRLHRTLHRTRRLYGRREGIPVYVAAGLPSPCLFGVLRPAIYLTAPAVAEPDRALAAVTHELTHYRQRDNIWAFLRVVCLVVYWFDPFVWLAAALSRRDCELSCDAGTVKVLGEDRRYSYGRALLDLTLVRARPADLLCGATTMTGAGRALKERIAMIAKKPRTSALCVAIALLMAAVAVGCTVSGSAKDAPAAAPSQDFDAPAPEDPEVIGSYDAEYWTKVNSILGDFVHSTDIEVFVEEHSADHFALTGNMTPMTLEDLIYGTDSWKITYNSSRIANDPLVTIRVHDGNGRTLVIMEDAGDLGLMVEDDDKPGPLDPVTWVTMPDMTDEAWRSIVIRLLPWARGEYHPEEDAAAEQEQQDRYLNETLAALGHYSLDMPIYGLRADEREKQVGDILDILPDWDGPRYEKLRERHIYMGFGTEDISVDLSYSRYTAPDDDAVTANDMAFSYDLAAYQADPGYTVADGLRVNGHDAFMIEEDIASALMWYNSDVELIFLLWVFRTDGTGPVPQQEVIALAESMEHAPPPNGWPAPTPGNEPASEPIAAQPAETPLPPQSTEPPRSSQPAATTPPDILENMLAGGYTPTDDPGIFIDPNGMLVAVGYGEAMPPEG